MRPRLCFGLFSHPAILLIPLAVLVFHHTSRRARAGEEAFIGPSTMDSPLTVHGSLTIDGPATIHGVVRARRVIVDGPINSSIVQTSLSNHPAREMRDSTEVFGPLTVNGPLNVDDTLTIRGPLTCESWNESGNGSSPRAEASPNSQATAMSGFNRLQHWLGLPLGQ